MRKLAKKLWLPVATVLIIGVSVLALTGAMRTSQAHESEKMVIKPAEATEEPTPAEATEEPVLEASETIVAELETEPAVSVTPDVETLTVPEGYTIIPTENELGEKPGEDELSYDQAGAIAVTVWTKVFGEAFTLGSTDIYVKYYHYEESASNGFEVYAGSDKYDKASFICYMDSVSGNVRCVENQTPAGKDKASLSDEDASELMFSLYEDEKIPEVARNLINEQFAFGRSIEEIMVDGIQVDFNTPGVDILADCKVRMSDGDCYLVRVGYPTYDVRMFEVYGGWHSCIWGYWDESEAGDYPTLEEMGM